jgi:hypothetical protein
MTSRQDPDCFSMIKVQSFPSAIHQHLYISLLAHNRWLFFGPYVPLLIFYLLPVLDPALGIQVVALQASEIQVGVEILQVVVGTENLVVDLLEEGMAFLESE